MMREDDLLGKKLLVVTAHPDDESYMVSGLIMKNRKRGGATVLVCATVGEKGASHLKRPITPVVLKRLRRQELIKVSKFLGIDKLHILGLPDGGVAGRQTEFYRRVLPIARQYRPDFVFSYGEDGISGHHDHVTAGRVARRVAHALKTPFVSWTLPPGAIGKALRWIKLRRKNPHYQDDKRMVHRRPNLIVPIARGVKLKSLRFHASQLDARDPFKHFPKSLVKAFISAEYFVVSGE